jgi:hypothetical protein
MKSKRKFARAKDWSGKKIGTVDVTNRPDYVGEMLNSDNVASVEVKHQDGRQDASTKVKGVRATTGAPDTSSAQQVKPVYMDGKQEARIGDVVSANGVRGIVVAIDGTFVNVLAIGTSKETGDTFVLPQRHIDKLPASRCHYLEKQILNLS